MDEVLEQYYYLKANKPDNMSVEDYEELLCEIEENLFGGEL